MLKLIVYIVEIRLVQSIHLSGVKTEDNVMKRRLNQLLSMICAVSIIMTLPGLTVLAEEIESESVVETIDDIDAPGAVENIISDELDQNVLEDSVTESTEMDVQDKINKGAEINIEDSNIYESEIEDDRLSES